MFRLTFLGAGSTIFAKNLLGDCILTEELGEFEIALHDIDPVRLADSYNMVCNINKRYNGKAKVYSFADRAESLKGARFIINSIQVGGYEPCTVSDFEIPKKYGLRQTIADTLGIGGIFRALRTIPVLDGFAADIKKYAHKDALFINYVNPMSILMGYTLRYLKLNAVGLCHSVQVCVERLLEMLGMEKYTAEARSVIAGINHQAWLLKIEDGEGNDLYPEIKRRSFGDTDKYLKDKSLIKHSKDTDLVRHDMMRRFGYYITESSEHAAEYLPYYIKSNYPELIEKYNIPLDEYPRRCVNQINDWEKRRADLVNNPGLGHVKTNEFAAPIIHSVLSDKPFRIHGNVMNTGLITNLPQNACVEVACLVDRNGISPTYVGALPEQLAALNRTNINAQLMAIEAAVTRKKEAIYQAAMLDPHTSAELSIDDIVAMCDDLFAAHKDWLPKYN